MKQNTLLRILGLVVFVVAAIAVALGAFQAVRYLISTWELTSLPGFSVAPGQATPTLQAGQTPAPSATEGAIVPEVNLPPAWDGSSRVTILVMGLDYRDWSSGEGAPRTDTMMLFTIDPVSRTAGILSIPRDLWVTIPGFQHNKINTAYMLGEQYSIPGGGPELARQTVEALLGVPIQYYAQVDFEAFVRLIDEIGGVKINVPQEIKIDLIGDGDSTIKTLQPGVQTLPGDLALAYARARYTEGGDFDRAQRQQQIIMGVRERVLSFDMIPTLVTRAPTLYAELSSGINTNLTLDEAIRLGLLALEIPVEDIQRGVISNEYVTFAKSPDGLDVLKPRPEQIRLLRDQIFTTEGPLSPLAEGDGLVSLATQEGAVIAVYNGSGQSGLASRTADVLRSQGFNVPESNVGDGSSTIFTTVIDYSGNPYTTGYLVQWLKVSNNNFRIMFEPDGPVDIEIFLGNDWANSNDLP